MVKSVSHNHVMKAYMGRRGTAPLILNLGNRWRWAIYITLRLLYPFQRSLVGEVPEPLRTFHRRQKPPDLAGIQTPDRSARSSHYTELSPSPYGPRLLSRYSDSLRAGRPGDRIPVGGEIFRTPTDRSCGPPSLLYNGYRVFPGGKADGVWRWPPTPICAEVKERVELYLSSSSCGISWPVLGWTLTLLYPRLPRDSRKREWKHGDEKHQIDALV